MTIGNLTLKSRHNMLSRECVGYIPKVNCTKSKKKMKCYSENKRVVNLKCHQILEATLNKDEIYEHTFPWLDSNGRKKG